MRVADWAWYRDPRPADRGPVAKVKIRQGARTMQGYKLADLAQDAPEAS